MIFAIFLGVSLAYLFRPAFRILGIIFCCLMLAGVYGCVKGRMQDDLMPPDQLIEAPRSGYIYAPSPTLVCKSVDHGDRLCK